MKTLIIAAHPNLHNGSRLNKQLIDAVIADGRGTIHELYTEYPEGIIDVNREQQLLLAHDRIIFQFPFWWYSTPSLLKKWFDEVLLFGFAYGDGGNKLHGKEWGMAITTGGPAESYSSTGYNKFSIDELTRPFQVTCSLIGMKYLPAYTVHGAHHLTDEELAKAAEGYVGYAYEVYSRV
ncbi:General stress protein 14 [compost metagenome]